ncbi:inositol 1,4,5-trisphosphate receptor-interacting protein-like 1 isoform X2 [Lagopus muta]|uniref:inositol 1,4,5-trisphosphate receptor-interacting protein-like 1 isoform X2 n=1 Tax=Lagopus muta TaxID=64668 RepID=UPI00209DAA5E|nr:inositol 1,4,5-trisphosphate receptor-interacting protein-like 1 isoform X2 [Lagopus muta]XP_048804575.1 inositol 1,4,5-trisphosphate receptor-interacting protein-like 1 isoform X2 [Lagopus muta]
MTALVVIMALAFFFALLAQRIPLVGDLDVDTLDRMQQREVYLQEQMTKLLLEMEEKNMALSMGTQALLRCFVFCLPILLYLFMWMICSKFYRAEDTGDESSSSEKEQEEEEEEEEEEEDDGVFSLDVFWTVRSHQEDCELMYSLMRGVMDICQSMVSDTFYPVPERLIKVGSTFEGWCPVRNVPVFSLLVPLLPPRGHTFHLDLGTTGEVPATDSRIRVELECTCEREQEMRMLCFLHTPAKELKSQQPSLLHSLCTTSYLDAEKTARCFQELIKNAWQRMQVSEFTMEIDTVKSRRSCRLHVRDVNKRIFYVEFVFGVQQDDTDIFLSSHEIVFRHTPSTVWPQSCVVAEKKFLQYVANHPRGGKFYLRYLQLCGYLMASLKFTIYDMKTVIMHLLNTIPLQRWHGRNFLLRMDDILNYLCCCVEEKRLDHFIVGNNSLPKEIILPKEFRASPPLNMFQHLEEEPDKYERAQHDLEELHDRLTTTLLYGR